MIIALDIPYNEVCQRDRLQRVYESQGDLLPCRAQGLGASPLIAQLVMLEEAVGQRRSVDWATAFSDEGEGMRRRSECVLLDLVAEVLQGRSMGGRELVDVRVLG